jgi:non-ribosomal peptide synthetase component F
MSGIPFGPANDTRREYPDGSTLPDLLDAAAARHPDRPAVRTTTGPALTHGELADRSSRMARRLRRWRCGTGQWTEPRDSRSQAEVSLPQRKRMHGRVPTHLEPARYALRRRSTYARPAQPMPPMTAALPAEHGSAPLVSDTAPGRLAHRQQARRPCRAARLPRNRFRQPANKQHVAPIVGV